MTAFDGIKFELDQDPAPGGGKSDSNGTSGTGRKRRGRPPGAGTRKANLEKELSAELAMMIQLASAPILMRDPYCGNALLTQSDDIGAAVAAIVIDHERAIRFLQSGGSMFKYVKLAMALQPVALTVRMHHFGGAEGVPQNGYPTGPMADGTSGFPGSMGQG